MHPYLIVYLVGLVLTIPIVALATYRRLHGKPLEYANVVLASAVAWPLTALVGILELVSRAIDRRQNEEAS